MSILIVALLIPPANAVCLPGATPDDAVKCPAQAPTLGPVARPATLAYDTVGRRLALAGTIVGLVGPPLFGVGALIRVTSPSDDSYRSEATDVYTLYPLGVGLLATVAAAPLLSVGSAVRATELRRSGCEVSSVVG